MKDLEQILKSIREAREEYDTMALQDNLKLSDILRKLNSNLFYLTEYRIEAYENWLDVYFKNKNLSMSNAAAEKLADDKVKELYMIRQIMASGNRTVDGIRSQIGIYKKE